ncbi:MAG: hypothetical protein KME35_24305 [Aphanocapsa sp. GSE-SYN-MK-11-07L]|jgi:Zn finger protein HypA/HybF involved in hydrogenase expression|nr:hypothetical protein [Aphanocapsa sp. GSE-SYN-MK-11-07L]
MRVSKTGIKEILELAIEAIEEGANMGFCIQCGAEHYYIEPDAQDYECEDCGKKAVYGAEEILIRFGF